MSDYQAGKDVSELQRANEEMRLLLQQVYAVVDYNLKIKKLEEPKEKK